MSNDQNQTVPAFNVEIWIAPTLKGTRKAIAAYLKARTSVRSNLFSLMVAKVAADEGADGKAASKWLCDASVLGDDAKSGSFSVYRSKARAYLTSAVVGDIRRAVGPAHMLSPEAFTDVVAAIAAEHFSQVEWDAPKAPAAKNDNDKTETTPEPVPQGEDGVLSTESVVQILHDAATLLGAQALAEPNGVAHTALEAHLSYVQSMFEAANAAAKAIADEAAAKARQAEIDAAKAAGRRPRRKAA